MHKIQLKSTESIFESFRRIHLAFVKTQFAFFNFLKIIETLYKILKINSELNLSLLFSLKLELKSDILLVTHNDFYADFHELRNKKQ